MVEKVDVMVLRMQYLGYSKKSRYQVVDSALEAYKARQEANEKGERPLHSSKERWKKEGEK